MKIVVVYNEKSGSGFTKRVLSGMMTDAGIEVIDWITVGDNIDKQLALHLEDGRTIAVVGGDGTQRAVAGMVQHTKAIMAPLPGGTLNHFTKDLGVPQGMDEAIARLPQQTPRVIDVATVNDRTFVNNSSVGLYPHSLLEREKTESKFGKWPAAVYSAVVALIRFRRHRLRVNGEAMRTPFIFVGNNQYDFRDSVIAERNSLTKGHMTLFILRSWNRRQLMKSILFDRFQANKRGEDFSIDHPKKVTIESRRELLAVSLDGEVEKLATPLVYEIHPKSLKVLV